MNYSQYEAKLTERLSLDRRPVAIRFSARTPSGVAKFEGSVPSGCSFWRLAAAGRSFYTVPGDHLNCPIGAYTHNIAVPADRTKELPEVLQVMSSVGYIRMDEVPGIPQLPEAPAFVVYTPLGEAHDTPDVVLVSGKPGHLMLLTEAAIRSGSFSGLPLLGRPTCMAVPAALESGMTSSLACIGNRVYTDVEDSDLYTVFRGSDLAAIVSELDTVASANATLSQYHHARRQQLTAD